MREKNFINRKAFTLIELLIVVAIIAILAAIAVPNFLEAQTRSKVSRVKADMRTAATALESYYVDWNKYPYDGYVTGGPGIPGYNYWFLGRSLSTPIAYITNVQLSDPFREVSNSGCHWQCDNLRYTNIDSTWNTTWSDVTGRTAPSSLLGDVTEEFGGWRMNGAGPDRTYGPSGWYGISNYPNTALPLPYDPTNGTVSNGDIIRTQKSSSGYVNSS